MSEASTPPAQRISEPPFETPPALLTAIYATHIEPPNERVVLLQEDGFIAEILKGPFSFRTSGVTPLIQPGGMAYSPAPPETVQVPAGTYLAMRAAIRPLEEHDARADVSLLFAQIAGIVQAVCPYIVAAKVFEGPMVREGEWSIIPEHGLECRAVPGLSAETVRSRFAEALPTITELADNDNERLQLACRLVMRALILESPIDRLLTLWTVLEIYCRQRTDVVRRVSTMIGKDFGKGWRDVKSALLLNNSYYYRCKIVHEGLSHVRKSFDTHYRKCLDRLEATALYCIRRMAGAVPGNLLDEFLNAPVGPENAGKPPDGGDHASDASGATDDRRG